MPTELIRMRRLINFLLLALPLATIVSAQGAPAPELTPDEISLAEQNLKMVLVLGFSWAQNQKKWSIETPLFNISSQGTK